MKIWRGCSRWAFAVRRCLPSPRSPASRSSPPGAGGDSLRVPGRGRPGDGRRAPRPRRARQVTVDDLRRRRKHLRRPATELARIADVVHGLALAAEARFRLEHGSRLLLQTAGDGDVGEVTNCASRPVSTEDCSAPMTSKTGAPFAAWRSCAEPARQRGGPQFQFVIINNRAVQQPAAGRPWSDPIAGCCRIPPVSGPVIH